MSLVPAPRLLWLVFYTALVAVGAGVLPELRSVWLLALAIVALAALVDAVLSLSKAKPPTVSVPPVARFSRGREGFLSLTFTNAGSHASRIRVGLALPSVFASADGEIWIDLPEGAAQARARWACTPSKRGRYTGVLASVERDSALGLWHVRRRERLACDLRVHANLLAERKHVAALFLPRGDIGTRVQRTLGRGREFEKLRDYLPGDGFDEIHWKATAKRNRPVTKVFQAERTQEIYVVIDASRLSGRPVVHDGQEQTLLERYVTSALILLLAAARQGDKFGLVAHGERVQTCVRAGSGSGHYAACREAVLSLSPGEGTPDTPEIVRHLRTRFQRRALLFFLTDLSDPVLAEDFVKHVGVLTRHHLVLVGQLPAPEIAPLFSGAEVSGDDDVYRRLAGHTRWTEIRTVTRKLKTLGVSTVMLDNEAMASQLVTQYMLVKARQAL